MRINRANEINSHISSALSYERLFRASLDDANYIFNPFSFQLNQWTEERSAGFSTANYPNYLNEKKHADHGRIHASGPQAALLRVPANK